MKKISRIQASKRILQIAKAVAEVEASNKKLTPFEIAKECREQRMRIIGRCKDIVPDKNYISGCTQDIGVCAEYEDGERIWCHYSSEMLNDMLKIWGRGNNAQILCDRIEYW